MLLHVMKLSSHFDGLRIDNAHSTPIAAAAPLLAFVRRYVNPDLFVVAELFSGSQARDKRFCENIGIDALIRELGRSATFDDVSALAFSVGGTVSGCLSDPLWQRHGFPGRMSRKSCGLPALLFDRTHDNLTIFADSVRAPHDVLSGAALTAAISDGCGSVWGHDLLTPQHIPVTAQRLYCTPQLPVQTDSLLRAADWVRNGAMEPAMAA